MKTLLFTSLIIGMCLYSHAQLGVDVYEISSDEASNYQTSTWTTGANNGSGFMNWQVNGGSNPPQAGAYVGQTAVGNPSFGLYSNSTGFANAIWNLNTPLREGDTFSVDLGHTTTIDGEIFIQFLNDSGGVVFTLKFVNGNSNWLINDGGSDFNSGQAYNDNATINLSFTYEGGNDYSYVFGNGSGSNFTANNNISSIQSVKFQSTNQGAGENFGFNNLKVESKYTIPNGQTSNVTSNTIVPYLDVQTGAQVNVKANNALTVNGDITNNGEIIFESNNTGSGQLDSFSGSILGNGVFTVERFISVATEDTRAFRLLTSAVDSDASIHDNWQEGGNSPAGFGTYITGAQGTVGNISSGGFDETLTGNPSMYTFDNTFTGTDQSDAWEEISNTNSRKLFAGEAYRIFIRGDRNYNLNASPGDTDFGPNSDVTLRATGSLLTGNQTFTFNNNSDDYSLVGNPYQAIVDMNTVMSNTNTTNINTNYYWVWDPNVSSRGGYVAVQLSSGDTFEPGTSGGTAITSDANEYVMPGQSFFVQTTSGSAANLEFTEASKDVSPLPTSVFSDNNLSSLNLKLFKTEDLNNNELESDALQIDFNDQFANAVTIEDADKLGNPDENLARVNNGEYLTIEKRAMPVDGENLAIFTDGYTATDYTFVTTISNMPQDVSAYLIDDHSGEQNLLNEGENDISFTVNPSSPGSVATDRFSIAFEIETFGVDDSEIADNFKVYPNPVENDQVTIQAANMSGEVDVSLSNMLGQRVISKKGELSGNGEMTLNIGDQQSGVYFIEVSQDGLTVKERLIIK